MEQDAAHKKLTNRLMLTAVVVILILAALAPSIRMSMDKPHPSVPGGLTGVQKFTDGEVTCYVLDRWDVFRSSDKSAGISCVTTACVK